MIRWLKGTYLASAGLLLAAGLALAQADGGEAFDLTLLVNPADPKATDAGEGAPAKPFRTIQAAATLALAKAEGGQSVRVLIQPGVYREGVRMVGSEEGRNAPIRIESAIAGEAFLLGSSPLSGWDVNSLSRFERQYDFREQAGGPMLFVAGARMVAVDSPAALESGRVYFDESGKRPRIVMLPPKGGVVAPGSVEISRGNEPGFHLEHVEDVTLHGLVIERGFYDGVRANQCAALILNELTIDYCRRTGVAIEATDGLRLRQVVIRRCGSSGLVIEETKGAAATGSKVALNGWQGGGGFAVSFRDCEGVKLWNFRVSENQGNGVLLAGNSGKIGATGLYLFHNELGLELNNDAPAAITASEFAFNRAGGLSADSDVLVKSSVFYDNGAAQVAAGASGGVRLQRCIVVSAEAAAPLVRARTGSGYEGSQNLFYAAQANQAFAVDGLRDGFAAWQELVKSDLDSYFGEPELADPANYDFLPLPSSPFFEMKAWPVRELD